MAGELNVLCAGAVKGLVLALQPEFERISGLQLASTFGAVGAMREQLDGGAILEYFAPLNGWLEEQNKGQKCDWKAG